jgi:hypothetical protein
VFDGLFFRLSEKDDEAFLNKFGGDFWAVDNPGQMEQQFRLMV